MMNRSFEFHNTSLVNGIRVKQARELCLLTQGELALKVGVSQAMIAHIENGLKQPSLELTEAIAHVTNVSVAFLCKPSGPSLPEGSMLFRARADVTAKKFAQTRAAAEQVLEIYLDLSSRFTLPPVKLRPLEGTPEQVATEARKMFGLAPDRPVPHLMRAFERAGGIIIVLPEVQGREAFAVWSDKGPVVAIAPSHSGDRIRFSMAHEIGHLLLHQTYVSKAQAEKEAHRFAAELLMPHEAIISDLSSVLTLQRLGTLKQKWGVSMAALALRARDLEVISRRQYERLARDLGPWRMEEPSSFAIPLEKPRVLRQMAESLFGDTFDAREIAERVSLPINFVSDVIKKYASNKEINESRRKVKVVSIASRRPVQTNEIEDREETHERERLRS